MLRKILFTLVAVLTLSVGAQAQQTIDLKQEIEAFNKQCPMAGDGYTIDKALLSDKDMEFHMTMDYPASQATAIQKTFDQMRPALLKEFVGDAESRQLFKAAAEQGYGFSMWIHCKAEPLNFVRLIYTAQELKGAL